jgi:hypothetical protein
MRPPDKRNRPGGGGSDSALIVDLPRDAAEVAQRLQRRLSAFALVTDCLCRDVTEVQRIAGILASGFDLTAEERQELNRIALRLFDAAEVLA